MPYTYFKYQNFECLFEGVFVSLEMVTSNTQFYM